MSHLSVEPSFAFVLVFLRDKLRRSACVRQQSAQTRSHSHLCADAGRGFAQGQYGDVLRPVQPVDGHFGAGRPFHHRHVVLTEISDTEPRSRESFPPRVSKTWRAHPILGSSGFLISMV